MQRSFYGGPQGQNFQFKTFFPNRAALEEDINNGFNSEIGAGEFILITYGDPHDINTYNQNIQKDKEKYSTTYNNTVWRKIYTDKDIFGYEFITDISGISPSIRNIKVNMIDSYRTPSASAQTDEAQGAYNFEFNIPKGTRIFSGYSPRWSYIPDIEVLLFGDGMHENIDDIVYPIQGMAPGDFLIDSNRGILFELGAYETYNDDIIYYEACAYKILDLIAIPNFTSEAISASQNPSYKDGVFQLPRAWRIVAAPQGESVVSILKSGQNPSVTAKVNEEAGTIYYEFQVPKATQILPNKSEEAIDGDFAIDGGILYQLQGTTWTEICSLGTFEVKETSKENILISNNYGNVSSDLKGQTVYTAAVLEAKIKELEDQIQRISIKWEEESSPYVN